MLPDIGIQKIKNHLQITLPNETIELRSEKENMKIVVRWFLRSSGKQMALL